MQRPDLAGPGGVALGWTATFAVAVGPAQAGEHLFAVVAGVDAQRELGQAGAGEGVADVGDVFSGDVPDLQQLIDDCGEVVETLQSLGSGGGAPGRPEREVEHGGEQPLGGTKFVVRDGGFDQAAVRGQAREVVDVGEGSDPDE